MGGKAEAEPLRGRIGLHYNPSDPDAVYQNGLPQVPLDEWYEPIGEILGKCEGPPLNTIHTPLQKGRDETIIYSRPTQTRFVRVMLVDGEEVMETYDPNRHGLWRDIPDTGLTPAQLLEQIMGFGANEINQGQQFQRVRKKSGGAAHKHFPIRSRPPIKRG